MLSSQVRVLIIDDDNLVSVSMSKVLTKLGYKVETCLNPEEADRIVGEFEPNVILLDIYLTTHNGLDLLKNFKNT